MLRGQKMVKIGQVWHIMAPDNTPIPVGSLADELSAAEKMESAKRRGELTQEVKYKPMIKGLTTQAEQESMQGLGGYGGTTAAEVAASSASAETVAKGQATRGQDWINRATAAAEAYPVVGRALTLLKGGVKTGGWDNLLLKANNFFGVTGADELELSNNLGQAVLSQLREKFGAAFTVEEVRRLEAIEANYGKSTEGNIRLLEQAQKIANEVMKRGIKAAKDTNDTSAIEAIERGYVFSLDDPLETPAGASGQTLNFDAQGNLIE
jgi:hypothetical protein